MVDVGALTRELMDAFVKDLRGSGGLEKQALGLARDHALAYKSDAGDARFLALADVRDSARSMRSGIRTSMKRAGKDSTRAESTLEYVMDASPWIGEERLAEAHLDARTAEKMYFFYSIAKGQLRQIIRAIGLDLACEAAEARERGVPRTVRIARRLVEIDVRLAILDASRLRRRHWTALDALASSANPGRARLRYAVRVLLRRDR